jgi:periplasmic protein CpxP/Spy
MKTWIKRSLIGLFGATVLLGGLSACGHRGDSHGRGWSDERVAEMRGKAVQRIAGKLELTAVQKAKLDVLADELVASRKALRGDSAQPRDELMGLIAGEQFDRVKAQQLFEQKTRVVQGQGPKLIQAFGEFYDSLNPEQRKKVRERLDKRGHGGWGRG